MGVHGPVLERAENASLDLRGVIREYVDAVIDNWVIPLPDTNPAIMEMFEIRDAEPYRAYLPWSGEFAGKYLTGAVQLWRLTGSAPLRERIAGFVARLAALQDPADGYLGPYPKAERLALWDSTTNEWTWDLWNHYHLMLGLLLWFEDTGDRRAFACARAIADLVCARFLETGTAIVDLSYKYSTEMNHAVLHGVAILYRITGTDAYLRMAEAVVGEFRLRDRDGEQAGDYVRRALAGTEFHRTPRPRWESLHALMGLAELYYATGNPDYRTTVERFWWSIVRHDRHNNGGFSSGEGAVGSPYHPGSIETCCTANGPRGFGMISDWALMRDGDGLVLNWYGPSTIAACVGDTPVTLRQDTEYPRNGRVTLTVDPDAPLACVLKLRIPYWSAATTVAVNGRPVSPVTPGCYLTLARTWRPGDVVELDLDLSLRYWTGERECAGRVSVYAGPLLMALRTDPHAAVPDLDAAPIDPAELSRRAFAPVARSAAVLQAEHAGHTIVLEDFGTVGAGGDAYRSWLPARTGSSAPFSTSNPGRTWRP